MYRRWFIYRAGQKSLGKVQVKSQRIHGRVVPDEASLALEEEVKDLVQVIGTNRTAGELGTTHFFFFFFFFFNLTFASNEEAAISKRYHKQSN